MDLVVRHHVDELDASEPRLSWCSPPCVRTRWVSNLELSVIAQLEPPCSPAKKINLKQNKQQAVPYYIRGQTWGFEVSFELFYFGPTRFQQSSDLISYLCIKSQERFYTYFNAWIIVSTLGSGPMLCLESCNAKLKLRASHSEPGIYEPLYHLDTCQKCIIFRSHWRAIELVDLNALTRFFKFLCPSERNTGL